MKSYFGKFIPLLSFIAVSIVIINAIVFFSSLNNLIDDQQWVNHSHIVIAEVESVFSTLKEAESDQRGFLLTNDAAYIDEFHRVLAPLKDNMHQLVQQVRDNPSQRQKVTSLQTLFSERITLLQDGIVSVQNNSVDVSQDVADGKMGKQKMVQIKLVVASIEISERQLLAIRTKQEQLSIQGMYTTITLAMLINLLFVFVVFFFVKREFDKRTQTEQRKNDFISIASHELKTPITSMGIFADMLQRRLTTAKDKRLNYYVVKLREQIQKQTSLINDLLDISKMQAGQIELLKEPFDLNTLVRETVETVAATTTTHKIIVRGKVQKKVFGDRQRIGQVVTNFLSNAIKYSPNAHRVIVSVGEDHEFAFVSVQDFGIGIAKRHHRKIFQKFYRADEEGSSFPGMGIGLYVTYEIVRRHDGRVSVESKRGKGSTFTFTIPCVHYT